ncbi:MFS transporter [Amycolatopsis sp. WGS_07]|uniref:MFS transporter n=1 Tax=Amycolatopsis sp. WGS_07 TaxID=3076764 RepID=UPI0038735231
MSKPDWRWAVAGGTAVVLVCSVIGVVRAFAMDPAMDPDMPMPQPDARMPLQGMPLSEMPEMFAAAVGLLLVIVGTALRTGRRPQPPPDGKRRLFVAVIGTAALTIDVSKTSTLGFVIPGLRAEYGLDAKSASFLAVAGLTGTAIGAVVFGVLADRWGRRGSYLVATLAFAATSMCGSMPTFGGNIVMCALMGTSVGGLAPLLIVMLTDALRSSSRSSAVIALSVLASAVGYLVAAGSALWLEPVFGWRVLWLIGAPTGLALAALTPWVPDRIAPRADAGTAEAVHVRALGSGLQRGYAFLIGVLTFGLTTWVPSLARSGGLTVSTANLWLSVAAVVMVPCALLLTWCHRRFGPVRLSAGLAAATAVLLLVLTGSGAVSSVAWVCAGALVAALFSVNTMAAVFLPIAADLADPAGRGRTTGAVSLCNRLGGLCGPLLIATFVYSASDVLVAVAALALCSAVAACWIGRRQRIAVRETVQLDGEARAR